MESTDNNKQTWQLILRGLFLQTNCMRLGVHNHPANMYGGVTDAPKGLIAGVFYQTVNLVICCDFRAGKCEAKVM